MISKGYISFRDAVSSPSRDEYGNSIKVTPSISEKVLCNFDLNEDRDKGHSEGSTFVQMKASIKISISDYDLLKLEIQPKYAFIYDLDGTLMFEGSISSFQVLRLVGRVKIVI